jgi:succinate dehydrogenase hydrophobic membrane anchor protein
MGILILNHPVSDYISWISMFDIWLVRFGTLIFFYVMFFHAWIGILHVTDDYIKNFIVRRAVNFCFLMMIIFQLLILSFYLIK